MWVAKTGLATVTPDYDRLTPWDMGSILGALFSARVLGLLGESEYHERIGRTLNTLERLPLFDDAVFNRMYFARSGALAGRGGVPSSHGYAWSATDLGRLLTWLSIVGLSDPVLKAQTVRIARRIDFRRVVSGGYLYGEEVGSSGATRRFQEGRIGYEQYAAHGFALWGQILPYALDLRHNAESLTVLGVALLRDKRGLDRLTSEPFVLLGLELGWTHDEASLARNVLLAQEQRFRTTGIVTVVSEDAIQIKPYYFFYYCVYCNGRPFVVDIAMPGKVLDSPRWVSTKATFAWHALLPSVYTRYALEKIGPARNDRVIASGVFEGTSRSTHTQDLNVVAVVLEAAAYRKLGRPLLYASVPAAAVRR